METESALSSVGPNFGSEIGSSFSFADTVAYNAPLGISGLDGGSYNPNFNFTDTISYTADVGSILPNEPTSGTLAGIEKSLEGVILDPDLPKSENSETSETSKVGLAEPDLNHDVKDNLLEPQTFLEAIYIVDQIVTKPHINTIEQINYSPEIQEKIAQTSVIPSDPELVEGERGNLFSLREIATSSDFVESPRNDSNESAVLVEMPVNISEDVAELTVLPNAEIVQAITTYESLKTAGIEEAQAVEIVQNALILLGTEPETVKQILIQVRIGTRNKNSHAEFISASDKIPKLVRDDKRDISFEDDEEEKEEEEEEKTLRQAQGKKRQLKFVVDEKALVKRRDALQRAIEQAPTKMIDGIEVVNSAEVVALMPTGREKPSINSEILPLIIDLLDLELNEDGTYLEANGVIGGMGLRRGDDLYREGVGIFRKLPPVALAQDGELVGEKDRDRVFTYKPDPICQLRKRIVS